MGLSDITAYVSVAGVVITFLVLAASVIFRIGRLTQKVEDLDISLRKEMAHHREVLGQEIRASEQRINHNHELIRADIQRLFDAMASHTHDTDGNVVFRVPPSGLQTEPEESAAG